VPGQYLALVPEQSGGAKAHEFFTVGAAAAPGPLQEPQATVRSIEFGFRGPTTLKDNTMIRGMNEGWLVHMNDLVGVKSRRAGQRVISLLRAGKDGKAFRYTNRSFYEIFGPVSHGAVQQQMMKTKPGYYVEVCFMNTQDGREHTQLGMERLVKVVK